MKTRTFIATAAIGLTAFGLAWVAAPSATASRTERDRLEVHEWGTFTSMQGTSGLSLEGLHHEEEALPSFVHRVVKTPATRESFGKGGFSASRVREKMETPVIYFYADKKTNVTVDVSYSDGIMSEWFPAAVHHVRSDGKLNGEEVLDVSRVQHSSLRWDVEVFPRGAKSTPSVPKVADDDPWQFARETSASIVRDKKTGEADHYLFYRGLGKRAIDLSVEQSSNGDVRIRNKTGSRIPASFLLEVGPNGARWNRVGAIGASRRSSLKELGHRPSGKVASELRAAVKEALIDTGLFADEAEAMVKTWSRSWFESEGSRLIYIVPRKIVDSMLPLNISPRPDVLVRTLVGRLEYITPEVEKEIKVAVCDRFSRNRAKRVAAKKRLDRLGRYLEPHLRLIIENGDAKTAKHAKRLLRRANRPTRVTRTGQRPRRAAHTGSSRQRL